ncbi:hypothetical protein, partial [Stenotrophomonas sp. 3diitr2024]|uniref:hypothetical protein n=1 Tax=Stenotrophomonas sp. 3diitr2024 TaxID=3345115 RepID=UPI0035CA42B6
LGFNPFRHDSFRRVDDAESEARVGGWKIPMQTVSTVGVLADGARDCRRPGVLDRSQPAVPADDLRGAR